jgi:hypothetical protein
MGGPKGWRAGCTTRASAGASAWLSDHQVCPIDADRLAQPVGLLAQVRQ